MLARASTEFLQVTLTELKSVGQVGVTTGRRKKNIPLQVEEMYAGRL